MNKCEKKNDISITQCNYNNNARKTTLNKSKLK